MFASVAAALLAPAAIVLWFQRPAVEHPPEASGANRPDMVLFVIDTLRADAADFSDPRTAGQPLMKPSPLALPPLPSNSIFPLSEPLSATSPLPWLITLPSTVPSTMQSPEETIRLPSTVSPASRKPGVGRSLQSMSPKVRPPPPPGPELGPGHSMLPLMSPENEELVPRPCIRCCR